MLPAPFLLERETELAELEAAVDAAVAGAGRTVLVEATAGTGKSALLRVASARAEALGVGVLRAAGGELERDFAFGAVRQLFEPILAAASKDERDRLLGGSAEAAAALVDPVGEAPEAGFPLLHALYWLLANLTSSGPLLLVVDDLHWVDEASLRGLDYLARRLDDLPVAIVGAVRPAEPGAQVGLLDALRAQSTVITPSALSLTAVGELVRRSQPGADADTCAAFGAASAGNPLYLLELLHAAPDAGAEAIRAASVPGLGDRIVRRIGRVAAEAPAFAAALSVLGDGQPLTLVTDLAELEPATTARLAHELVRIGILASDEPPTFAHPVIRHSVYAGLSGARRSSLHAAAAELLETAGAPVDAVAAQLSALPPARSDAVAARLVDAAHDALSRAATAAAVRRLHRALDEGAKRPARWEVLFSLGRAEAAGRDPGCIGHLQEAFALAPTTRRAEIAALLLEVLAGAGQWGASRALLQEALAGASEDDPARGDLLAIRAIMMANDPEFAGQFFAEWESLDALSQGDTWPAHATAALLASQATFIGYPRERVLAYVERATRDGRLLAERRGGSWAAMQVQMALVGVDALDEAEAWAAAMAAAGRRTGATLATFGGMAADAWVKARRGDLVSAEASIHMVTSLAAETGMTMWVTSLAYLYQDVLAERRSLDGMSRQVDAVEIDPEFQATYAGALLLEARSRIALARGDRKSALGHLRAVAEVYEPLRVGPVRSTWRSMLAIALAPDDPAGARAVAAEELELARAAANPRALGIALRTSGVLAGDAEQLRESLAVLDGSPATLECAYSHLELGVLLRRTQRLPDARDQLAAAAELAHRCGAERLFARATDELHAAGGRPRRIARSGRDALTPREFRVAELAAVGRSNRQIAQELFLSQKTVETHLTSAYGKLGLSGQGARTHLAAALAA